MEPRSAWWRALPGVVAALLVSLSSACAAGQKDYRFEVADQPVAVSAHSEFDLMLTKADTGAPVEGATITRSRLEMTMTHPPHKSAVPGTMTTTMGGEVKVVGTPAAGLYRLIGDVSMPGTWKLDVVAMVPGEPEPVEGTATFRAGK